MSEFRTVPVGDIKVVDRHRRDLGDLDDLAESIRAIGLLHPIVVTSDLRLVAGERRLAAVKRLNAPLIAAHIASDITEAADLLAAERDENTCRKDMAPSEKVALGLELEKLERPKARENQRGGQGGVAFGDSPKAKYDTRSLVSRAVGLGEQKYAQAKKIVQAAEARDPVAVQARRDMDETGNVNAAFRYMRSGGSPRTQRIANGALVPRLRKQQPEKVLTHALATLQATVIALADVDFTKVTAPAGFVKQINETMGALRKVRSALTEGSA